MSEIQTDNVQDDGGQTQKNLFSPLTFFVTPFRFIGSLTFGIILLAVLLFLLALGTFIESEYGSDVARFVLYGNHWFAFLTALLALNITLNILGHFLLWRSAAFLTTHIGILFLLYGCYLTFQYGEEAQITLPEGTIGCVAVKIKPERQQIECKYIVHSFADVPKPLHIPFRPGPFSWQDYHYSNWVKDNKQYKTILWWAMQFGHRDIGELSSDDPNVKIEVLDYFVNSTLESVPPFDVSVLWKKSGQDVAESGEVKEVPRNWESLRLELQRSVTGLRDVRGSSASTSQGERVTYSMAVSTAELTAFQKSRPRGGNNAGLWGEIVLYYGGNHYSVNVDQLLSLTENKRFSIEGSDLQIGNVRFKDKGPIINLAVFTPSGEKAEMTLFPDNPELNVQSQRLGIFGSYWVDPQRIIQQKVTESESPPLQRLACPRLDFMQGTDKKLYYRLWSGQSIIADGVVPDRVEQKKPQFKAAEQTPAEVEVVIDRFVPQDVPGCRVVPSPISRMQQNEQRVKLRVQFNNIEDTFWIRAVLPTVVPLPPEQDQIRYIYGDARTLCVQLNFEHVDLGFGILLKKFEQRTEPGTRMPSHFSSLVDYVEPIDPADAETTFSRELNNYRVLPNGENILISMNRPGYFAGTGRGYRIYQSSYVGPFYPDQPQFYELYDGTVFPWESRPRESISMSTLSVNADPGRGWKYIGCFLIVLGIALFMRKKGNYIVDYSA